MKKTRVDKGCGESRTLTRASENVNGTVTQENSLAVSQKVT